MSNLNCTGSSSVANQLRFITLYNNGNIKGVSQNSANSNSNIANNQTIIKTTHGFSPAQTQPQDISGQNNTPEYQYTLSGDSTSFSNDKYAADDGKISTKDKLINFGKGVISPVTMMFSSPKNFAIGAAGILGGTLLIAATGGAIAPVMAAAGITGGAIGLLKSGFSAMNAKTDDEARKAWQGIGLSSTATIGSIAGSKAALKGAGIDTKNMSTISAVVECFKSTPKQVGQSVTAFTSGKAITNIKNAFHLNKNTKTQKQPDSNNKPDIAEPKPETDSIIPDEIKTEINTDTPENIPTSIESDNIIAENITDEASITVETPAPTAKPRQKRKAASTRRRQRPSRIKHEVSKKQANQVKQEAKNITEILDDFAKNSDIDQQFRDRIEDVRRIAAQPMEDPKGDVDSLISTIKHLESCRDNPETIAINGKEVDFPFDDAISYVEKLLSGEYKVDRLQAKAGDVFDNKTMAALEVEHTNDSKLNNTIFKMLFSGFKKQEKKTVPSGWKIKVIKYSTD